MTLLRYEAWTSVSLFETDFGPNVLIEWSNNIVLVKYRDKK